MGVLHEDRVGDVYEKPTRLSICDGFGRGLKACADGVLHVKSSRQDPTVQRASLPKETSECRQGCIPWKGPISRSTDQEGFDSAREEARKGLDAAGIKISPTYNASTDRFMPGGILHDTGGNAKGEIDQGNLPRRISCLEPFSLPLIFVRST